MKVLVIGGGGREHALCWKLAASPLIDELFCAPGNPGIAKIAACVPKAPEEIADLVDFASQMRIDLTVVGPELPLSLGIVDAFVSRGLRIFGPKKAAAELEGSKIFAKEFMLRHGIPTARFRVAHAASEARKAIEELGGLPIVLKADGLAAGKGVLMVADETELEEALGAFFVERRFGASGERILVEEMLHGEEVSFIGLADGHSVLPLATSKDYKRIGEGDTGPNTGGMGAHSPAGLVSSSLATEVLESVLRRTVEGMASEGRPYRGFLYAGVMLTEDGPKVLEYNVRLGDPETQALMLRVDGDLVPALVAGADGDFRHERLRFRKEASVCLVLAGGGYPGLLVKGQQGGPIQGIERAEAMEGVVVFQAGTALKDDQVVVAGGRVLNVCASGPKLVDALRRTYMASREVEFAGKTVRRDIGRRILERRGESSLT